MVIIRSIIGLVSFFIAVAIAKVLLGIIGFALHLLWLAIIVGFFILIGWIVYKIIFPRNAEPI